MIVICSSCSTRLQLDETKLPSRPFTIRCPKCQTIINGQPPTGPASPVEQSALSVGNSPAVENVRYKKPTPAPAFKREDEIDGQDEAAAAAPATAAKMTEGNELARLLAELLQRSGAGTKAEARGATGPLGWETRRALVCVVAARRAAVALLLAESDYEVYVAEDTSQAIERMRENHMNVIVLEAEFDPIENGAAFVTREVNALRPQQRRRLLFVHLTATARTLDTHAAFVQNVNLVVNVADLDYLPHALERATRDFKELYRDLNAALNVATY
ncbi:MAG TPA: zinc-ribbon domain-containing protein [Pyrinomonadaceae bacterium]|jgi:predicted Zn finger-like uncharacterized protein